MFMLHAGAQRATYEQIKNLPVPMALGRRHKPIPHVELIDAVRTAIPEIGTSIDNEQFALHNDGALLLAFFDLALRTANFNFQLALRSSVNSTRAVQFGAGRSVFLCDNTVFSAEFWVLRHKSTTGFDLFEGVRKGVWNFLQQAELIKLEAIRRQVTAISPAQTKELVFDEFASGAWPVRLFPKVAEELVHPQGPIDMQFNGTLWQVEQAFTHVAKELVPNSQLEAVRHLDGSLSRYAN